MGEMGAGEPDILILTSNAVAQEVADRGHEAGIGFHDERPKR